MLEKGDAEFKFYKTADSKLTNNHNVPINSCDLLEVGLQKCHIHIACSQLNRPTSQHRVYGTYNAAKECRL